MDTRYLMPLLRLQQNLRNNMEKKIGWKEKIKKFIAETESIVVIKSEESQAIPICPYCEKNLEFVHRAEVLAKPPDTESMYYCPHCRKVLF